MCTSAFASAGPRHSLVIRWLSDQESSTTASPDGPLLASGCDTIMVVHEGDSGSKDRQVKNLPPSRRPPSQTVLTWCILMYGCDHALQATCALGCGSR